MDYPHAKTVILALGATITLAFSLRSIVERRNRTRKILKHDERVLILGASSGIGRAIAHLYAQRGARVCVVGRRGGQIEVVEQECKTIQRIKEAPNDKNAFSFTGDISNPEDMVTLRDVLALGAYHLLLFFFRLSLVSLC
jgi:NADPH:quinone reductase-like Zn-dependent oxidoreductase